MSVLKLGNVNMLSKPVRIALLGAESTGKTSLCLGITSALQSLGLNATAVPETLREWCDAKGRTPHAHEQAAIATRPVSYTHLTLPTNREV